MRKTSRGAGEPGRRPDGNEGIRPTQSPSGREALWIGAGTLALALIVRAAYLYDSADFPTFRLPIVDSLTYHKAAVGLARGEGISEKFFWQPFFYPFFLGGVYAASDSSIVAAKLVQALLGSVTCLLASLLALRLFGRWGGIAAGAITALYAPLVFFETELLATGMAAFWAVALVWMFLKAAEKPSRPMLLLGTCGAISALTRPTFVPFFAAGCAWLLLAARPSGRRWRTIGAAAAALAVGFALPTVPVAVANLRVTGHFGFLPASGGLNLYLGNNPDYQKTVNTRPGQRWLDVIDLPAKHGVQGDMWVNQRFYYRQVGAYLLSDPLGAVANMGHKALQMVNSRETPRNVDVYLFRRWSVLLRVLLWKAGPFGFPFGVLGPLAVVGAVLCVRKVPVVVLLVTGVYLASVVLVFVTARYRAAVVPLLAVLAAGGAVAIGRILRARRWRRLGAAGGCIAATVLVGTLPGPFAAETMDYEPELHFLLCDPLTYAGRTDRAISEFHTAIGLKGDFADAHAGLASLYQEQQQLEKAREHYEAALAIEPDWARVHTNLGNVLLRLGDARGAIRHYREGLQTHGYDGLLHANLAAALDAQGQTDEALRHARQALRLIGDHGIAHNTMGWLLEKKGRHQDAIHHYKRSIECCPSVQAHTNLGNLYHKLGRFGDAAEQFEAALKIRPRNAYLYDFLARARWGLGQTDQAVAAAQRAAQLARQAGLVELEAQIRSRLAGYRAAAAPHGRSGQGPN